MMQEFIAAHWLDMLTTLLGLAYIVLEYHASIWLWVVGFAMQSLGIVLYYQKGLYADCGMEFYYLTMTVYGFLTWRRKSRAGKSAASDLPITHFPVSYALAWTGITLVAWGALYWFLATYTDSRVPLTDAFTTALSIVALWALAHKYVEQWLLWFVVDAISFALYIHKGIPFKACIYGIYTAFAIFGYLKWLKTMKEQTARES